ncbi:MAG: hypothetical protein WKF28_02985 [Rubrobacteraceae bacterium]
MLPAEVKRHRFTVEEYHRMGETGLLSGAAMPLRRGFRIDTDAPGEFGAGPLRTAVNYESSWNGAST